MYVRRAWKQIAVLYALFIAFRLIPWMPAGGIWPQFLVSIVFGGGTVYAVFKWDKACSRYWRLRGCPEKTEFSHWIRNPVDRRTGVKEIDALLPPGYIWLGAGICLKLLDVVVLIPLSQLTHTP